MTPQHHPLVLCSPRVLFLACLPFPHSFSPHASLHSRRHPAKLLRTFALRSKSVQKLKSRAQRACSSHTVLHLPTVARSQLCAENSPVGTVGTGEEGDSGSPTTASPSVRSLCHVLAQRLCQAAVVLSSVGTQPQAAGKEPAESRRI